MWILKTKIHDIGIHNIIQLLQTSAEFIEGERKL